MDSCKAVSERAELAGFCNTGEAEWKSSKGAKGGQVLYGRLSSENGGDHRIALTAPPDGFAVRGEYVEVDEIEMEGRRRYEWSMRRVGQPDGK
jgi:hypothetical protein